MNVEDLVTGKNLELAGSIFVLMSVIKQIVPTFWKTKIGQRILPVLPILIGVAGAFIGLCENCVTWQDKLLIGLLAGAAAAHTFKLARTSLVGYGLDTTPVKAGKKE